MADRVPLFRRVVDVRPGEGRALAWSFLYFFCLLTAYYLLRPMRDERGVAAGVETMAWLWTGTFVGMLVVAPLWSALVSRFSRARLLPTLYRFVLASLVVFFVLFRARPDSLALARVFFVWLSVFNPLAIAVFWGFMADVFGQDQGKRLFGFIAAGGSAGAILGPLATTLVVERIGPANLLVLSALLLEGAAQCTTRLVRWQKNDASTSTTAESDAPVEGDALSGIRLVFRSPYLRAIAGYLACSTLAATFAYFVQARLVAASPAGAAARTAIFARVDLGANVLTVVLQVLVTGRLMARFGVGKVIALFPPLSTLAFAALAAAPTLTVSSALQAARRGLGYGVANPATHVLFTVVGREQKYKSKAFIETVVYRGSDFASAWVMHGLFGLGLGVVGVSLVALPLGALWLVVALLIGRHHPTGAGPAPPRGAQAGLVRAR